MVGSAPPFHRLHQFPSIAPYRSRSLGGRPGLCIFIVRRSRELGSGGELQHLLVVGIGDVHDVEWISSWAALVHRALSASCVLRLHWRSPMVPMALAPQLGQTYGVEPPLAIRLLL